jgi:hypothetical protein
MLLPTPSPEDHPLGRRPIVSQNPGITDRQRRWTTEQVRHILPAS